MDFTQFYQSTGYQFKNETLINTAFTHRSFLNENRAGAVTMHNEKLEFLGDAVLELIVTKYLFLTYPDRTEGELTSFRAALVRTESLAESALKLGFGDYLFMSKGEEATGGRTRPYILANTFEAVVGAMYLDGGLDPCTNLVNQELLPKLTKILTDRSDIDAKSRLQELAQEVYKFTPVYEVVKEEGPDHDRIFTMKVLIDEKEFGTGSGKSKQEAEQQAASQAILEINKLSDENSSN